ncbi:hypothetical protein C8Q70DRAFT_555118 [Cubamyces menziesii]|nr:hypothetical protein C8Q70DRAFT_555118 [Cubamyces menziesii]
MPRPRMRSACLSFAPPAHGYGHQRQPLIDDFRRRKTPAFIFQVPLPSFRGRAINLSLSLPPPSHGPRPSVPRMMPIPYHAPTQQVQPTGLARPPSRGPLSTCLRKIVPASVA